MKVSQWRGASFVELRRLLPQTNLLPPGDGITCQSAEPAKVAAGPNLQPPAGHRRRTT
jgi:hypothetical protein